MTIDSISNRINEHWTDIYHSLHYIHEDAVSHQVIRLLQHIEKHDHPTIGDLSIYLNVTHNTASEHIKRLIKKGYVTKEKSIQDERKVYVMLTEEGKRVVYRNTRLDAEKLALVLQEMTPSQRKQVEEAFILLSEEAKRCF